MLVTGQQGGLDGLSDLVGLGLPCTETDGGDFAPSVELEGESGERGETMSRNGMKGTYLVH